MNTALQEVFQHPPLSQEAQFALDYSRTIDPAQAADNHAAEEAEVMGLVEELHNVDEQLLVLDSLYARATNRRAVARLIETHEDEKYGDGMLEDVPKAGERMLNGKNPFVVVRAETLGENAGKAAEVLQQLIGEPDQFENVGVQKFPKQNMPTGSTGIHLDNFTENPPYGFRYAYSMAQVDSGKLLFMGGIAGKKGRNTQPKVDGVSHPYDEARTRLDADPRVQHQYSTAQQGRPRNHSEFTTVEGRKMATVVLHEGDVVIWPQGGEGSKDPAWHAFRKIGNSDRKSTSYHYAQARSNS